MADFVAVLKKTLEGLGDTTPETREKVYAKARGTISAKLNAINPPPPQSVVDRQVKALDEAIALVEAEYAAPPPPPPAPEPQPAPQPAPQAKAEEDLEAILASLQSDPTRRPVEPDGVTPASLEAARSTAAPQIEPVTVPAQRAPSIDIAAPLPPKPASAINPAGNTPARPTRSAAARPRLAAPLLIGLIVAVVVAAAGYALWINRDDLGMTAQDTPPEPTIVLSGDEEGTDAPEDEAAADPAPQEETGPEAEAPEMAAVEPPAADAEPQPVTPAAPAADAPQKFTQRLLQDGSEVDPGPAGEQTGVGEGTSVATAVIPAEPAEPAAAQPDPATAAPAETPTEQAAAQPDQPALPVGQRAIFYEERTSSAQGSAETGSIVWSMAQESPGGDLPPEPAIRAEATIPGKDLQLRMTIRRNADQTLPASHIVEMIFLTPETFEGGGIENVLRMTMKDAEEAPGNALLGIPAKIADGFFLIALSDGEREVAQNTALMSRDQWIDIPIVYRSGRRALITMEKGIPGGRVFEEAIKAWQAARSG